MVSTMPRLCRLHTRMSHIEERVLPAILFSTMFLMAAAIVGFTYGLAWTVFQTGSPLAKVGIAIGAAALTYMSIRLMMAILCED
jgi:hypothetical protein